MLTMNGLSKKIKKAFNKAVVSGINKEERYLEALFNISRDYANQDSRDFVDFDIKKKLILALGIRLKLELILIDGKISRVENITTNQTRALFNKFRDFLYKPFIRVVNEVLILTPEFIHLNAFMYEPLIDVSPIKLKRLYKKIEKFEANKKEVWKDSYRQTNI